MNEKSKRTSITLDNKVAIELAMREEQLSKSLLSSYINRLVLDDLFGSNEPLRDRVVELYGRDNATFRESLIHILEYFIRFPNHRVAEIRLILDVMISMLSSASWVKGVSDQAGDREKKLACVYEIFGELAREMESYERYVKEEGPDRPWENAPGPKLTQAEWFNRKDYSVQAAWLKERVSDPDLLPGELILLVSENWNVLRSHRSVYEALIWCLHSTQDQIMSQDTYKRLRLAVKAVSRATSDLPQFSPEGAI